MKPDLRTFSLFAGAFLLTGAAWVACWPGPGNQVPAREASTGIPKESSRDKARIDAAIATLQSDTNSSGKLQAALQLGDIPAHEIRALLETVELIKDRRPSLVARTLLIRWASSDGDAAMNWAWQRFRADPQWREFFQDIGPAWAWRDPKGFGKWVLARMGQREGMDTVRLDEAMASGLPLLESDQITMTAGWLMKDAPQEATKILMKRGGFSSDDGAIWASLDTPQRIQEALLAFDNLDSLKDQASTGTMVMNSDGYAVSLLASWKEMDPEGFAKSPYAESLPVLPTNEIAMAGEEWKAVPPENREEAAPLFLAKASAGSKPGVLITIAKDWMQSDPEACGKWLPTLPDEVLRFVVGDFAGARAVEHLNETMAWLEGLSPAMRDDCLVRSFDSWTAANPKGQPDMSAWTEDQQQAWRDFEALKAAGIP